MYFVKQVILERQFMTNKKDLAFCGGCSDNWNVPCIFGKFRVQEVFPQGDLIETKLVKI